MCSDTTQPGARESVISRIINVEKENRELKEKLARYEEMIAHLESLNMTDRTTGVLSRGYFTDTANRILATGAHHRSTDQKEHKTALVLIDLDYFKLVNDTFGHLAGDEVLAAFGTVAREHLRATDLVGRWGGDEFIILLQEIMIDDIPKVIVHLRQAFEDAIHELTFGAEAKVCQICPSFSFGFAEHQHGDETLKDMIARADKYLYRQKNARKSGR